MHDNQAHFLRAVLKDFERGGLGLPEEQQKTLAQLLARDAEVCSAYVVRRPTRARVATFFWLASNPSFFPFLFLSSLCVVSLCVVPMCWAFFLFVVVSYGATLTADATKLLFTPAELAGVSAEFITQRTNADGLVVLTLK